MDKIHRLKTYRVGTPVSPAHWIGKPRYEDWMELTVTSGGGMGGSKWHEYIQPQQLPSNQIIYVDTIDGHTIQINTAYIVKAEQVKIVFATYRSDNPNFQRGLYRVRWITPYGENELVDRYINDTAPDRGEFIS